MSVEAFVMTKISLDDVLYIEETSITVRGYRRRTTVPSRIFRFMDLHEGDILRWVAMKDGTVVITKSEGKKVQSNKQ